MDELGSYAKTESELKERLNQQMKFLTALGLGQNLRSIFWIGKNARFQKVLSNVFLDKVYKQISLPCPCQIYLTLDKRELGQGF